MNRKSRAYRLTLLGIVAAFLGGGGYAAYYLYSESQAQATLPGEAEQAYQAGKQSLEAGEFSQAMESLEKSDLLAAKGLAGLEEDQRRGRVTSEADYRERKGKLLWTRAQALRDKAFAAAALDKAPLDETEDSTTGEKFRSISKIEQRSPESFQIAALSLREAADLLPRDLTVQQEALRMEMMLAQQDWGRIERRCKAVLDLNPENVRARSRLATLEFEQFQESTGKPLPDKDKSRERVETAREHLQVVKKAEYYPIWRTLDLEARIQLWLARKDAASPLAAKKKEGKNEEERLRDLLFDSENGILARARRQEGFRALSEADITGLRDLHLMAVEFGIDQARTTMGSQTDDLFTALRSTIDLANSLGATEYGKPSRGVLLKDTALAAYKARRFLGSQTPEEWPAVRDGLEKLARKTADAGISSPVAYALVAQLLNNDAYLEGRRGNAAAKKELETRALSWVDEGLKVGKETGEPAANLVELYGVGLEILLAQGAPVPKIQPYMDALKKVNDDRANALVGIQEAAVLVRQGKFTLAKAELEKLLKNDKAADVRPRALTLLANVMLSTQDSINALTRLRELEKSYSRVEDLSALERAFMLEFLLDPRDIASLIVVAELETALEKLDRYYRENPRRAIPDQGLQIAVQNHEQAARLALGRLANKTDANRKARVAFANYYLRRGLTEQANAEVRSLRADYPTNADVLRLEVALAMQPPAGARDDEKEFAKRRQLADGLIRAFVAANPTETAGKLFWAEWLVRTNRSEDALAFLEDPVNFPGERDEITRRLLAVAMLNNGDRDQGVSLLQKLPKDRTVEMLLIQTSANPEQRQQLLDEAMAKYENNGQFRLLEGERLIAEGKYAEAADLFWRTQEFTRVRGSAQQGLLRSLQLLAETNPDKALEVVEGWMKDAPAEPVLYGIAALALMKKDEFGASTDVWERNKTMYGALNAWMAAAKGLDDGSKMLFRARFWLQANRPDKAWDELDPSATRTPYNEEVLKTLVEIAMLTPDDQSKVAKAVSYVNLLKQLQPNSAVVRFLDARLSAVRGDRERAIALLERLVQDQPKFVAGYPELIHLLNDTKQPAKAAQWTDVWLTIVPGNPVAEFEKIRQRLAAGHADQARELGEAYIIETEDRVQKRFATSNDPDLARVKAERVRVARAAAELGLAEVWMRTGDYAGAAEFLARSLKDDPKSMNARLTEAQLAIARKEWAKARDLYEAILKGDKNNYIAKTNLAWLLAVHLDKPEEGLKMIRAEMNGAFSGRPVAVERLTPEFLDVLGAVLAQAAKKKVDPEAPAQMKSIFETAIQRYPSDPRIYLHLGEALDDLAEKGKATTAYQTALRLAQDGKGSLTNQERRDLIQKVNDRIRGL